MLEVSMVDPFWLFALQRDSVADAGLEGVVVSGGQLQVSVLVAGASYRSPLLPGPTVPLGVPIDVVLVVSDDGVRRVYADGVLVARLEGVPVADLRLPASVGAPATAVVAVVDDACHCCCFCYC
jgi:hypothetical protein